MASPQARRARSVRSRAWARPGAGCDNRRRRAIGSGGHPRRRDRRDRRPARARAAARRSRRSALRQRRPGEHSGQRAWNGSPSPRGWSPRAHATMREHETSLTAKDCRRAGRQTRALEPDQDGSQAMGGRLMRSGPRTPEALIGVSFDHGREHGSRKQGRHGVGQRRYTEQPATIGGLALAVRVGIVMRSAALGMLMRGAVGVDMLLHHILLMHMATLSLRQCAAAAASAKAKAACGARTQNA